ncbi:zinc finger, CCHC-type containing protein [Tanacetum coccineum]
MIIQRVREVQDIVLIITPSYELGFRRFNSLRDRSEKIYNLEKDDDARKIVDSIDLNGATRNTTRLHLFCYYLRDQAINWLDRLSAGSISTWDDLTTRFLAQFFSSGRTAKLQKYILTFQQCQDESLCDE